MSYKGGHRARAVGGGGYQTCDICQMTHPLVKKISDTDPRKACIPCTIKIRDKKK